MKRKALVELTSRYVDGLNTGAGADLLAETATEERTSEEEKALAELLPTIQRLKSVLVPIEPSPAFSEALGSRLIEAWHEQQWQERARQAKRERKSFFLRAAAVGSFVSLAAFAALMARSRVRAAQARAQ